MPPPRVMIPDLPLKSEPEGTDYVVIQDDGGTKRATVASVQGDAIVDLDNHINDNTDAHAASAISTTDSGNGIDGTTVQGQLGQLATAVDGVSTTASGAASAISDHITDTSDAHDASAVSFDPAGTDLSATDVQAAIEELEDVASGSLQDASEVEFDPSGTGLSATDVQAAIVELESLNSLQDASEVEFDPTGTSLASVNVQDAITELDINVSSVDVSGFAEVYVHDGSDYILSGGRIFVGPEDPADDGFTLNDGDQWLDPS